MFKLYTQLYLNFGHYLKRLSSTMAKGKKIALAEKNTKSDDEEMDTTSGKVTDKTKKISAKEEEVNEAKENGVDISTNKKSKGRKTKNKPAVEPARKSSRAPTTPLDKDDESYEVEKLVDFRVLRGKPQYLVRWKGYTKGDDTWQDEAELNCPGLLNEFKEKHPDTKKKAKKRAASTPTTKPVKKIKTKEPEKDYEVEDVVGMRVRNGKKEFKIRWKGFKPSDDTWEPVNLLSCNDLINAYIKDHKDKEEVQKEKTPSKKSVTSTKSRRSKTSRSK